MKTLQIVVLAIALLASFASCQPASTQTSGLSNAQTRDEIMQAIASDSVMSKEMIAAMMNGKNGMMQQHEMMMGDQRSMMNTLKNKPGLMQPMLSTMMETAKGDSAMMSGMITTMMGNPKMMEMMQERMGNNGMNGMKNMGGMGK